MLMARRGFTLIELLVVIAIIAVIHERGIGMALGGWGAADAAQKKNPEQAVFRGVATFGGGLFMLLGLHNNLLASLGDDVGFVSGAAQGASRIYKYSTPRSRDEMRAMYNSKIRQFQKEYGDKLALGDDVELVPLTDAEAGVLLKPGADAAYGKDVKVGEGLSVTGADMLGPSGRPRIMFREGLLSTEDGFLNTIAHEMYEYNTSGLETRVADPWPQCERSSTGPVSAGGRHRGGRSRVLTQVGWKLA